MLSQGCSGGGKKQDLDPKWPPGSLFNLSPNKCLIGAMWGFSLGSAISGMLDAPVVARAQPCDTQLLLNWGLRTFIFVVGAKSGTVHGTDLPTVKSLPKLKGFSASSAVVLHCLPLGARGLFQLICNTSLVLSGCKRCVAAASPPVSHPSLFFAGEVSCTFK